VPDPLALVDDEQTPAAVAGYLEAHVKVSNQYVPVIPEGLVSP